MSVFFIVFRQVAVMAMLVAIGYLFFRKSLITPEGSRSMSYVLIRFSIPCVLLKSYMVAFSMEKLIRLGVSFALSGVAFGASILISSLLCRKTGPEDEFGASYANAGFMGIPLVQAVLGESAVFDLSAYIAWLNILQWSYGYYIMSGRKKAPPLGELLRNPILIALAASIAMFLLPIEVPEAVQSVIVAGNHMMMPLSMLILGTYLAQSPIKELFTSKSLYRTSFVSLVVVPAAVILLMLPVPKAYHAVCMVVVIASSTPVGSNAPIVAEWNQQSPRRASQTVCQSTLLSILTLPVMITLAAALLG